MKNKKQSVQLREKLLNNDVKSLYLDIWHDGKRSYEFLKIYLVKPKSSKDREENRQKSELADDIRSKRQQELKESQYGFRSEFKQNTNFLEYFEKLTKERLDSMGNYGNWESALKHLTTYCDKNTRLGDVNIEFAEGFKNYLSGKATTKSKLKLSQNTQHSYFNKFKASINKAFNDGLIPNNPIFRVHAVKPEETQREYLTLEELKKLVKTECKNQVLKEAFIFCCLTGIRWSDVQKLTWNDVQDEEDGFRIIFRQQKTKGQEYLDISNQARDFMGKKGDPEDRVFLGLKYSAWHNMELQKWVMKAGISKTITFHCSRHTFAVMQLNFDTDIYTVSKLLGHTHLKTTQIYAKIVDEKKKLAMNKIPNINL